MTLYFLRKLEDTDVSLWRAVITRNTQTLQIAISDSVLEVITEEAQYVHFVSSWMDWREILQS